MQTMRFTAEINAPRQHVFDMFTDLERTAEHVDAIVRVEVLTDGPVGRGTRFRETRVMFRREATEEMQITTFDRPCSYVVEGDSCGVHWRTAFQFAEGNGSATRVDVLFELTPTKLLAKIMMPMTGWMMTKSMRTCIENDLADMKRVCETAVSADLAQA